MNIAFTGYKNIASVQREIVKSTHCSPEAATSSNPKNHATIINMELNNVETQDYDDFKDLIKQYTRKDGTNGYTISFYHQNDGKKDKYMFNNHTIEVEDKTLPIFSKVSKLMQRISNDNEEFYVDRKYQSNLPNDVFHPIRNKDIPLDEDVTKQAYSEYSVKTGAEAISNAIKNTMTDYFA